ncbi:MAG TPA: hypothetical protein PLV42_03290 [bacterium]|nr:hypothetical protein [bacterium]
MRNILGFLFSAIFLFSCDNGISFDDPALDACVRNATPITDESHLDQSDLDKITTLVCGEDTPGFEENGISNLSGIERLHNLRYLNLYKAKVSNISLLAKLEKLKELNITSDQKILSYEPLTRLPLTFLGIHDTGLEDISFLANIPTLEEIDLERNAIIDISVLAQLDKLVDVDLQHNKITTVAPLAQNKNLANMERLAIYYNCIDCMKEIEYLDAIAEQNPDLKYICNPDDQLLPENCGE